MLGNTLTAITIVDQLSSSMKARFRMIMNWMMRRTRPLRAATVLAQQRRCLSLHEYQAHDLLHDYGVSAIRGRVVATGGEAQKAAEELGGRCALRAQILKTDRKNAHDDSGLSLGIQLVDNPLQARGLVSKMLSHQARTLQNTKTSPSIDKVFVTEIIPYDEKWYVALTIDRETYTPVVVVSKKVGDDFELVMNKSPTLHKFPFYMSSGITDQLLGSISRDLEISKHASDKFGVFLRGLFAIFRDKDGYSLEVETLLNLPESEFTCSRARLNLDDAAHSRQKDLFALRDKNQEVEEEVEAEKYGLIYVRLEGNIGNVVNGAGLAMATNDAIHLYGGASANFLDAGGQATKQTMEQAFRIVLMDKRVKAILVNVYGGITRCDMIAESIIGAATELGSFPVPVVVRLQGTNSEKGLSLLKETSLGLHVEADFGRAAQLAVKLADRRS